MRTSDKAKIAWVLLVLPLFAIAHSTQSMGLVLGFWAAWAAFGNLYLAEKYPDTMGD